MYTNNEILDTEIRKKIPFTIATRKIKYLGINLTKKEKDLYSENYRTLKKQNKANTNKWKHMRGLSRKSSVIDNITRIVYAIFM